MHVIRLLLNDFVESKKNLLLKNVKDLLPDDMKIFSKVATMSVDFEDKSMKKMKFT